MRKQPPRLREKASVLLLNWKRPANMAKILRSECKLRSVGDILIFNKNPNVRFEFRHRKVKALNASHDFGLRTRWILGALAKFPVLIFQDDDLVLSEKTVRTFIDHVMGDPERIYCLHGRNPDHLSQYNFCDVKGEAQIALTRAAAVHRSVVPIILANEIRFRARGYELPEANGEDIFMSYCLTAHFGKLHRVLGLKYKELDAPHGLSQKATHRDERTHVLRLCQEFFKTRKNGYRGLPKECFQMPTPAC